MKTTSFLVLIFLPGLFISLVACDVTLSPTEILAITPTDNDEMLRTPTETAFQQTIQTQSPDAIVVSTQINKKTPLEERPPMEPPDQYDEYHAVAIVLSAPPKIIIIGQDGRVFQELDYQEHDVTPLMVWEGISECQLAVTLTDGNKVWLELTDLINDKVTPFSLPFDKGYWATFPALSQSGKWYSYATWSGEKYYTDTEIMGVGIASSNHALEPHLLATMGGASKTGGAWSGTRDEIAYFEFNEDEFLQLSLYEPVEKVRKIIGVFEERVSPGFITWSPLGSKIAAAVYRNHKLENQQAELWILDTETLEKKQIHLPFVPSWIGDEIYWNNLGDSIVFNAQSTDGNSSFYWVNVNTGEIQSYLTEQMVIEMGFKIGSLNYLFPLYKDLHEVGFFSGINKLYIYNP